MLDVLPQDPESFRKQIKLIVDDMEIAACKIGMIGSIELIDIIHQELSRLDVPIIFDPILASGTRHTFANKDLCQKMITSLLPITTLVTPNSVEAKALTQSDDLNIAAKTLFDYGADSVLITGTHENTENVINTFYVDADSSTAYQWQRLPDSYHGSGCTLSSRIAAPPL